ncbi:metallophosphoesterase family protein [Botrimarina hoheduenensis]|uniref:Putative metallophosphoesterase YhaO n=1 Tax=Botrimarina hoheduenensis TaxID=2528000 RepID=A0A5C5WDJ4_9BACT|nr:DNA repair exonuclease [Botrimarina hoheduenensis]TWT48978.1 putative metallophosphoesterase YhaO [Botrimarina hoheduenensis]
MFTFLHAADIHLDSPLRGLDRYEGAPVEEIRQATRRALQNLVDLALEEEVNFVVLAGDLYDGDWPDFDTGLFFVGQMRRLRESGVPVFGVLGNHDAASKITRRLPLPENVCFFQTTAAETRRVDGLDVAIHGQSFASQCTTDDLAKSYPAALPGCFNLGVLHTSMTGREGHDRYAPCTESCLRDSGYDYWALGHIHQREVLPGSRPTIAYPGNIQGRHIRETGPKGCLVVRVDDANEAKTEFHPLDVLRWEVARVALDDVASEAEALDRVGDTLGRLVEEADGRLVAARVLLTGATPLASALAANPRHWTASVRARAVDVGGSGLWVEKVTSQAEPPRGSEAGADDSTPVSEVAAIAQELLGDASVAQSLGIDFEDLRRKLPPELRETVRTEDADWWRGVLHEAQARLFAELRG